MSSQYSVRSRHRSMVSRDDDVNNNDDDNSFIDEPALCRECPKVSQDLKKTNYSLLLDQNVPFASVVQEMTKCLNKIFDYNFVFTSIEKSWLGKMEIPGVVVSHVKINIYCSHEPINRTAPIRYTVEAKRVLGDIPAFYNFVRELHVKLANKPADYDFQAEESEDLNEELVVQCVRGDASVVRRMLSLPQVDPTRYNKYGTTALHTICHHGHQHLFALLMEVKDDKMDLYLRSANTGRTPMETALDNKQMDFIEFVHEMHNVPLPDGFYAARPAVTEMDTVHTYESAASRAVALYGLANTNVAPATVVIPARPSCTMEEKYTNRLQTGKEPSVAALERKNFLFDDPSDRTRHGKLDVASQQKLTIPEIDDFGVAENDVNEYYDEAIQPVQCLDCPATVISEFRTKYHVSCPFFLQQTVSFASVVDGITTSLAKMKKYSEFIYFAEEKSWLFKMEASSELITHIKLNIYCCHEPIHKNAPICYTIEAIRILGDIPQFYSFFKEFLAKFNSKIQWKSFEVEEKEDLEEERSNQNIVSNSKCEHANNNSTVYNSNNNNDYSSNRNINSNGNRLQASAHHSTPLVSDKTHSFRQSVTATQGSTVLDGFELDHFEKLSKLSFIERFKKHNITSTAVQLMVKMIELYSNYYASVAPDMTLNKELTSKCIQLIADIESLESNFKSDLSVSALNACASLDRVSLIHLAAGMNDTELLSALLEHNADVNLRDGNNQTALHIAVQFNSYNAVKLLVNHRGTIIDPLDSTPVSPMSPLHLAAQCGHFKIVELLSERDASHQSFHKIRTPLHWAASEGQSIMCRELLSSGFADVNAVDANGDTALILSAKSAAQTVTNSAKQQQYFDVLNVLLLNNAIVDVFNSETRTVLHYIGDDYARRRVAETLVQKLFAAVRDNDVKTVTLLVNMGVSVDYTLDRSLDTALHLACRQSGEGVIVRLLEAGASADAQNHLGFTPLHYAAQRGSVSIVKLLLQTAPKVMLADSHGRTAMHYAAMAGYVDVLRAILLPIYSVHTAPHNASLANGDIGNDESRNHGTAVVNETEAIHDSSALRDRRLWIMADDALNYNANIVNINATTHLGYNLLSYAVACDRLDCIDFLFSCGARVNHSDVLERDVESFVLLKETTRRVPDVENSAPHTNVKVLDPAVVKIFKRDTLAHLYHASIHNCVDRVKYMIDSQRGRININQRVEDRQQTECEDGKLAWNVVCETALYGAVIRGHTAVVRYLLAEGADATIPSRNGWAPIFAASKIGHTDIVSMLITAPNIDINIQNNIRTTSLNIAAYHGHLEVSRILLKNGADSNIGDKFDARPLHTAAQRLCSPIVQLLLDYNADVNVVSNSNMTPLYVAAANGHVEIVEILVSKSADVNLADTDGLTPLIVSAYHGDVSCCELLLKAKANANHHSKDNISALHAASYNGHLEVVKLLRAYDVDVSLQTATMSGISALVVQLLAWSTELGVTNTDVVMSFHIAVEEGHADIVGVLCGTGIVDINAINSHGVTPLYIASQRGHLYVVERLLKVNADVNSESSIGRCALFVASQNGHTEIVRVLLSHHANVDISTNYGETALFVSAYFGHLAITRLLIDAGADVNASDNNGCTPLLWAAKNNKEDIVQILLSGGADAEIHDIEGNTPASIAADKNHYKVCWLLPLQCSRCHLNKRNVAYMPCKDMLFCSECNVDGSNEATCPKCGDEIFDIFVFGGVELDFYDGVPDDSPYTTQAVNRLNLNLSGRVCSCNALVLQPLVAPFFQLPLWEWWAVVEPQVNAAADPANAAPVAVEPEPDVPAVAIVFAEPDVPDAHDVDAIDALVANDDEQVQPAEQQLVVDLIVVAVHFPPVQEDPPLHINYLQPHGDY